MIYSLCADFHKSILFYQDSLRQFYIDTIVNICDTNLYMHQVHLQYQSFFQRFLLCHDQEFMGFGETSGVVEAEGIAFEQHAVVVDGNIIRIVRLA